MSKSDPIFTQLLTVTDDVVGRNGHVNNVSYVRWMQDVAVGDFKSRIFDEQMQELGCTWVARSHHIEYLRPAFPNDNIEISTWIENWRRVRSTRKYKFTRSSDRVVIAQGETDWVLINVKNSRPCSIPENIREEFQLHNETDVTRP